MPQRQARNPEAERRACEIRLRAESWSLTTLREKLVKIGARIVRHGRYVVLQLAEVAVPRALFAEILRRIKRLGRTTRCGGLMETTTRRPEPRGEPCAEFDQQGQSSPDRPAGRGSAAFLTRDRPSDMPSR